MTDFNDPLAHNIYGASDLFLMPSRFEPCGLSQMISMRYGSIPVVANTGGLHDTVKPATRDSGTGFIFQPGNAAAFLAAIQEALVLFKDKPAWEALQRRAMSEDFSWSASIPKYLEMYNKALGRKYLRPKLRLAKSHEAILLGRRGASHFVFYRGASFHPLARRSG